MCVMLVILVTERKLRFSQLFACAGVKFTKDGKFSRDTGGALTCMVRDRFPSQQKHTTLEISKAKLEIDKSFLLGLISITCAKIKMAEFHTASRFLTTSEDYCASHNDHEHPRGVYLVGATEEGGWTSLIIATFPVPEVPVT
ncbi:hypothetical protein CAPTEDRAFT_187058 [Capitella teleta]|uniref:Uncharacterized protein n=1 Tax=Capitella teleta TaxID=283909 RepID=R7TFB2_CAPTE|nr:hypothetical protein CAPTEDRAFT_187058 [Capitella teleta]|eukprot:ELT92429.1 hypothetical protein CAPTEDRAFT_187058 [Capitella teleta]